MEPTRQQLDECNKKYISNLLKEGRTQKDRDDNLREYHKASGWSKVDHECHVCPPPITPGDGPREALLKRLREAE